MAYKDIEKNYWVGEIRVKDATGKVSKRKKRGFKTKREALEWERQVKDVSAPSVNIRLEEFVEVYFNDKAGELKERSVHNKKYMIDKHIIPFFKGKKMNEISVHDLIEWQKYMQGKDYSESYLRMVSNQLTALFTHASKVYDLKVNPCKKVKRIGKSDVCRLLFWEKEEYDQFISTIEPESRYYVLFETLFWTGMRIGECLALTPGDIDFKNDVIHIAKTYYRADGKDIITSPKTEESVRDVVIPDFLAKELKDFIDHSYEMPDTARIFPVGQEAVQHKLKRQIEIAGVKKIPVHSIRHSACAYLISQGVEPMVIKKRLGHKDIKITLNVYGHLYKDEDQKLKELLSKAKMSPTDVNQMDSE